MRHGAQPGNLGNLASMGHNERESAVLDGLQWRAWDGPPVNVLVL